MRKFTILITTYHTHLIRENIRTLSPFASRRKVTKNPENIERKRELGSDHREISGQNGRLGWNLCGKQLVRSGYSFCSF